MEEPNVLEFMYVTCFFLFFFCFFVFLFLYSFVCRAILVKAKTDYLSAASHCTNVNFLFFFYYLFIFIILLSFIFTFYYYFYFIFNFIITIIITEIFIWFVFKTTFLFFSGKRKHTSPAHAKHRGHKVVLGEPRRKHSVLPPLQPCQYRVLGRGKY